MKTASVLLQRAFERYITSDPHGLAKLEKDSEAFRKWAFDTHPDAYLDAGLVNLAWRDRITNAMTPDISDLVPWSGFTQVVKTGTRLFRTLTR